jgi:hypothetical protein
VGNLAQIMGHGKVILLLALGRRTRWICLLLGTDEVPYLISNLKIKNTLLEGEKEIFVPRLDKGLSILDTQNCFTAG